MDYQLNEMQQKIVEHTDGAVMVLAGAGSGKTSVLTYRIANILNSQKAYPNEILAITFTNKAAGEMKTRLSTICPNANLLYVMTFHSFCAMLLRREISSLEGYNKNFSIYDDSDKKNVLKKIIKEHSLKEDDFLTALVKDIGYYKNANITLEQFACLNSYKPSFEQNIQLMREYEEVLKQNNALDFDDLLIKTLYLLKTNEEVKARYTSQFKYILVDEFQDTNKVQYQIVKILASVHHNIFAVGDEDQSIYSWRGANVANIQNFLQDFPSATLYKLEQNYRSTKNIIDCANKVIKHNHNRIDKTLFTQNSSGVRVEYFNKYSDRMEAEFVAEQIYSLTHSFDYRYSDIAILMRLNALSRSFEDKLLSYNIPYRVFGGLKFYDRMEIKNVLAYLKLIVNPSDDQSFLRIINFPKRSIGEASLAKLSLKAYGQSYLATLLEFSSDDFSDKTFAKFADFVNLMKDFIQKSQQMSVSDLALYIIKKLNLEAVFATNKQEDEHRMANLDELVASIKEFEEDNEEISLEEYLQKVSLYSDLDDFDENQDLVTIATVHSAKGLEFPVVFVVGLEEGYFPIVRDSQTENDMEEERRLMYVAVTRAKERLYLTRAQERFMYGSKHSTSPSRFLKEMDFVKDKSESVKTYSFSDSYLESKPKTSFESNYVKKPKTYFDSTLKKNSIDLKPGDKIVHAKFGAGKVLAYEKSTDILTAYFDSVGNKVLSAKFAPIKKI